MRELGIKARQPVEQQPVVPGRTVGNRRRALALGAAVQKQLRCIRARTHQIFKNNGQQLGGIPAVLAQQLKNNPDQGLAGRGAVLQTVWAQGI
jgi:hypothetical protein